MEQLSSIEGVFLQHDMKGLTAIHDVIESTVQSLRSLGVSAEFHGLLLSVLLMSKLSSNLRLTTSQKFGDKNSWDFANLLNVIKAREHSSIRHEVPCQSRDLIAN